jgi:hypothetical protein
MTHNRRLLTLALLTGVLSYAGVEVIDRLFARSLPNIRFLPGIVFGVLVVAPGVCAARMRLPRQLAAVVASAAIFGLAAESADCLSAVLPVVPACAIVGSLAALALGGFGRLVLSLSAAPRALLEAAFAGALGEAIIGIFIDTVAITALEHAMIALGFVVWQVGVALALFRKNHHG